MDGDGEDTAFFLMDKNFLEKLTGLVNKSIVGERLDKGLILK